MAQQVLLYGAVGLAMAIEGAIFFSFPWILIGEEFVRALSGLFQAPTFVGHVDEP